MWWGILANIFSIYLFRYILCLTNAHERERERERARRTVGARRRQLGASAGKGGVTNAITFGRRQRRQPHSQARSERDSRRRRVACRRRICSSLGEGSAIGRAGGHGGGQEAHSLEIVLRLRDGQLQAHVVRAAAPLLPLGLLAGHGQRQLQLQLLLARRQRPR